MSNSCEAKPRFAALIPFFVFVVFYVGLSVWAHDFYKVPMPAAFAVASAAAFFLNRKTPIEEKVNIYATGMGEINIMLMCLIFILAGAFASVAKSMPLLPPGIVTSLAAPGTSPPDQFVGSLQSPPFAPVNEHGTPEISTAPSPTIRPG